MEGGSPTIVTNSEGGRTTPSVVAYAKNGDRLVGQVRPPAQSPRRDALYPLPARRRSRKAPFFGVPTFGTRRAASRAAPRASRERAPVGGSEGRAPNDDTHARVPRPTPRSWSRALPRRPPPSDRSKG